jgi:hypothetical protein
MEMKYISIKDGYSCKAVNPHGDRTIPEQMQQEFHAYLNPELPLTEHVEVGKVFSGVEVWQLKYRDCPEWFISNQQLKDFEMFTERNPDNDTRIAIHPTQTVGEGEKEIDGWIKVGDRVPPVCTSVLAYGEKSGVNIRYFSKGYETLNNQEFEKLSNVTFWQPLPSPPKI